MQPIPESIRSLIKSRIMIGEHAPTARLKITGLEGGYTEPVYGTPLSRIFLGNSGASDTNLGGNFVKRPADSKILVTYSDGVNDDVRLAVLDLTTEESLTMQNFPTVLDDWKFCDVDWLYTGLCGCISRLQVIENELYLYVQNPGADKTPGSHNTLKVYKSVSGLGTDFALLNTLYDYDCSAINGTMSTASPHVGEPIILESGRIVIGATLYQFWISGYRRPLYAIFYTDDKWVTVHQAIISNPTAISKYDYAHYNNLSTIAKTRNDEYLYTAVETSYSRMRVYMLYSTDQGATWNVHPYLCTAITGEGSENLQYGHRYFSLGDGYLYFAHFPYITGHLDYFYLYRRPDNQPLPLDSEQGPFSRGAEGTTWGLPIAYLHGDDHFLLGARCGETGKILIWQNAHIFTPYGYATGCTGLFISAGDRQLIDAYIPLKAVKIDREPAALAQRLTAQIANVNPADLTDAGYYMPFRDGEFGKPRNQFFEILMPGRGVICEMGYGTNLIQVFQGQIDDAEFQADGSGDFEAALECRDAGWAIIDKYITNGADYYLIYTEMTAEDIVRDLLIRAGVPAANISIEATGLTISEITFERCSYADSLEQLLNISGFELFIDEYSHFNFHYPTDRQPRVDPFAVILTGTEPADITGGGIQGKPPIVLESMVVTSIDGSVVYILGTDYTATQGSNSDNATLARTATSSIPDGGTVLVSYVYAAWVFQEGTDIFRLGVHITRRDIYGKVVVRSSTGSADDESVVSAECWFANRALYGIPDDKILFVDVDGLGAVEAVQAAADQIANDMVRGVIVSEFSAVPVFHLQLGDCIQILESSTTISEIYRIVGMNIEVNADGQASMNLTTKHYYYAPIG